MKQLSIKILALTFFTQIIFPALITAQSEIKIPKTFNIKSEGYREASKEIKAGDKAVKLGIGGIPEAIGHYLKAYDYNPADAALNYKIGLSYLRSAHKGKAAKYLNNAYYKQPKISKDILFQSGRAFQYSLEFDSAIARYDAYLNSLKDRQKKQILEHISKLKNECLSGKELVNHPKRVVINNAGEMLNSTFDDYNLLIFKDSVAYLSSRRPASSKAKPEKETNLYNEDIYVSKINGTEFEKARLVTDKGFYSKHSEDLLWIETDGKTCYLYKGDSRNGDLMISTLKKGKWKVPEELSKRFNSKMAETSISLTADGNTAYFISSNKDDSQGGKDIYVCHKNKKGKWEKAENIGAVINTPYDEESVFITPDGKTLYFSSKGHNTMGGFDIFRAESDISGHWKQPENLGFPINTPDDELFFKPLNNEKIAFFSAKREDTQGGYDIYKAIFLGSEKQLIVTTEESSTAYADKPISDIFARIPTSLKIDTTVHMLGSILDSKTLKPVKARLDIIDLDRNVVISSVLSDSIGSYRVTLPCVKKYGSEIRANDYMFSLENIDVPSIAMGKEYSRDFKLSKVEVGVKVVLNNIYFDLNKSTLTPQSGTELDKVVKFLEETKTVKIEISGHTDNVGSPVANTKLSAARAKSVVDYIAAHGIDRSRLTFKGYGSKQPVAPNKTEAGRKKNRRVEFKIIGK